MLDLLLIPAAIVLALALRAARRGDHRLHGHLMAAAVTVVLLRVVLHPRALTPRHLILWLVLLAAAGTTLLLGRAALAWREGSGRRPWVPLVHRTVATFTLALATFVLAVWFLRNVS
jgi:hypothetical protein